MKKTYDYEKIEAEFASSMKNIERGVRYTPKTAEKREKTGTALPFGLRLAGGFLVAALVGGSVFGALKYAEYMGSRITPGSDPGIDSVYTEFGNVTSFDVKTEPDEPAANCVFGGVTVIDTYKVTEDELKTALPLDHDYGIVRGVISEAAEKAGYKVFTYKQSDRVGVCVTKGGKLVFDRTSWALSRVPSRLIIADETPSGHGMIFFTQYSDFSGLYGGVTSVYAYDTVTGETAPVRVFPTDDDPVTVCRINSSAAIGYYRNAVIGYDENTGFINYQETFEPIYVESYDTVKAGEKSISNPYLLGYINGEYVIGTPLRAS